MGILAPTYSDLMAGAIYPSGAVLSPAQVEEWQNNHRLARMRALMSWSRGNLYTAGADDDYRRAYYAGALDANGAELPMWVSYGGGNGSPISIVLHSGWTTENVSSDIVASTLTDLRGGLMGCPYGTRRGFWSLTNAGYAGYWDTTTQTPFSGTIVRPSASTIANTVWSSAHPGSGANARMLFLDAAGYGGYSIDDGTAWLGWLVSPNPTWKMGAASPTSWVLMGGGQIYRSIATAAPTAVSVSNATLGIVTGYGVLYDSSSGRYHAWGSSGHAWSADDGITWTYDNAAPLNGADVRAMGCSDDGILVAAVREALSGSAIYGTTMLWASFDGGSNWIAAERIRDTVNVVAGTGRIEYGAGRFVLPCELGMWFSGRVAF